MTDVLRARGSDRWHMAMWGTAAALLLVPLVAMQFTAEVAWDAADFIAFGAMLVIACGAIELASRMLRRTSHRMLASAITIGIFFLVWAELSVGIF